MSSNSEFSTISSGEMTSLPKSLPSSRETTAECHSNSTGGFMPLPEFIDRFSLPRVVRLEGNGGKHVLLYKQQRRSLRVTATMLIHRYRHDVKVGPEIVIPEGYPGWFSVVSGNTTTGSARVYRRVESLVRAGVPDFLLATPLRAYTLTHSKMEDGNLRARYTKTTIRAGEVLRIVAVFQDTRKYNSAFFWINGNTSEKDRYAQCLDSHGCEVFLALSARGEFYAICHSGSTDDTGSDAVLYRLHHLARRTLPLRVRLVAGPLPIPLPREYRGLMQLETSTRGSVVLGCIVPERPVHNPEMLELVVSGHGAPRVGLARLGYPSEARLLASPKIQRLFAACSQAMGDRATEPRVTPYKFHASEVDSKEMHLKKIKPKAEPSKQLLQSLRKGTEQRKRGTTVRERNECQKNSSNSFLDRISKFTQVGKTRNPAKKSASFTFASRPQLIVKAKEKYSSLEPEATQQNHSNRSKEPDEKTISTTNDLETSTSVQLEADYSRVHDSLTSFHPPVTAVSNKIRTDDIYSEVCEDSPPKIREFPDSHVIARITIVVKSADSYHDEKEEKKISHKYSTSVFCNSQTDSTINTEDYVNCRYKNISSTPTPPPPCRKIQGFDDRNIDKRATVINRSSTGTVTLTTS